MPSATRLFEEPRALEAAIANAKLAYQIYKDLFTASRFAALASRGAHTQRVLWASTGVKSSQYRDVVYVEELVGPDTVNTMPLETLSAFRDHGQVRDSLVADLEGAHVVLETLEEAGVSLAAVTDMLLEEGVRRFEEPFGRTVESIERRLDSSRRPETGVP